jgi:DivIVA domain-containing protein
MIVSLPRAAPPGERKISAYSSEPVRGAGAVRQFRLWTRRSRARWSARRAEVEPMVMSQLEVGHSWRAGVAGQRVYPIMSHDLRGRAGRRHDCQPGRALQMRCLECGVETAEATPACVVCGARAPRKSAVSAWRGSRAWVKRYSVHQQRFWVKLGQAAGANALARPGGTGDSTADPQDSDAAGWAVPAAIRASVGQQPSESAPDSEVDGAILAEWVEARKFSTTRLRPGYDMEEVDAFANAIRDTFLGIRQPSLTPDEIRTKQFSTTRLRPGYDEEEVDAFLDKAESRLAAQASAQAHAAQQRSAAAYPAAGAVQIRCLECGAESAETEACARCGAPTSYQPSAADPALAQRAGRGDPSRRLLTTVGMASALVVVVGGIIAGLIIHSGYSTPSSLSTDQLTIYQLQTGDCLQDSDLENLNQWNGPFTAVPCTQPHAAEVVFAGNSWPRSLAYPGDQAVYDDGYARCLTAFSAYDGIDNSSSEFGVMSSTPDSSTWPGGDRWLACFATMLVPVDYSIRGSGQ